MANIYVKAVVMLVIKYAVLLLNFALSLAFFVESYLLKAEVKECRSLTEQLHPKWACNGKHAANGQNYSYGCLLCTQTCSSTPLLDKEKNIKL